VKTRQYQNIEKAKTYGFNLTARLTLKELTLGVGYSYLDTEAEQFNTDNDRMHTVIIDGMAHHRANVFATWNHDFNTYCLGIGRYGRMSSKRYYQINGNGKGYQLWRLTTSHDLGHAKRWTWRVEAGIDNILNYVDRTDHGLHLGTTTPGRTIYASLTLRFNQGKKISNTYKSNQNYQSNEEN
jgi:outer membrane receptor for ferrienterochelin and colicins